MKLFQDHCVSIEQYAQQIGKSRRTIQRYITNGMPVVRGCHKPIHIPTVNAWWESRIASKTEATGGSND